MSPTIPESLRIEINLREPRGAAERLGRLGDHAIGASELSRRIRELVDADEEGHGSDVTILPMPRRSPPGKMDAQIIDGISVVLAPMGVAAITRLVVKIIEACRARIPTKYELDVIGLGKFILSGEHITPQQVRELLQLLTELMKVPGRHLRINAKSGD